MTRKFLALTFILVLGLAVLGGTIARAQSVMEGKVTGTVTDDKGEILPGVNVEIAGPAIMGKRAAATSGKGSFVFLNVPPGKFTLTASLAGFKTWVQENLVLGAGSAIEVNPVLQIGAIEEQVTVIGASPIVDIKTSTVDSRLDKELLAKLPTSRDAFYDLALTTPGMFDVGSSGSWLPSPTAYGGSSMENVFLVNGVNTTNPRGAAFGSLVKVNYNAVEEVRVVALGSRAEYGSFSGAAIDVLTKSGSNQFHGNAAFYTELRGNTFFKPNYPITTDENVPLPAPDNWLFYLAGDRLAGETKKNWEGNFTLGGPIVKDKVWFYAAADYIRSATLPVNWSLLNEYWGRYADFKISAEPFRNSRAWVSYHYENNKGTGTSWGTEPEWDTSMTYGTGTKNNTLSAQWQWLLSGTTIFTAKYLGFWTDDQPFVPDDAPGHPGYINWWKWGTQYGVAGAFPYVEAQKSNRQTFQGDVATYVEDFLGEHDIKFGVQYTKGRGNWMGGYFQNYANFTYPLGGWWGYYANQGYAIWALQTQTWYNYGGIGFDDGLLFYNNKTIDNPFLTVRTADSFGLFLDDQWSPTNRLTFNFGLRYDRMTTKYGEGKVYEYLDQPSDINSGSLGVLRTRQGSGNIFDFKTISPRLGITYQLTKDAKTVVRANYGRYYMPLAVEFLRRFGPDMQLTNLDYEIYWVPWNVADADDDDYIDSTGISGTNELREAVRTIYGQTPLSVDHRTSDRSWTLNVADGVKDMYTDQFSLNLERELFKDVSLSATYIYKHTANIFVNVPINEVTGQEWEYERVAFDPTYGDSVDLYSVVWQDYNQDGKIDGADVAWIGTHGDYRVENMQSYNYTAGGDLVKPQRTYQAFQLVFNKRYSDRWQGLASMVYSWSDGTAQRTMRQNDNMMGPMITDDTWMGTVNYTINNMDGVLPFVPKWEIKASGSYTVPKVEMDLGLRFRFHTGRPLWRLEPYSIHSEWGYPPGSVIPGGGTGRIVSSTTPIYLPALAILDLRAEKAFRIKTYGSFHVVLDVFNIFNSANVTNAEYSGLWGRITGLSDARRFRLSFMYQF